MTIEEIYKEGCRKLSQHKIENPALNVGLILEEITGIKRLSIPLFWTKTLSDATVTRIQEILNRRAKNEPIQYIFGYTEFYGYKINVTPAVLIPRPETEYLLETIKNSHHNPRRIIDIGTGSGAIAIVLKKFFPEAEIVAVDISPQALKIAQANAEINNVAINFKLADIYSEELGKFDLIVSNPPYVTDQEYKELPFEVREFEPQLALVGQEAGLFFYRKIIELSSQCLNDNSSIYFEIGEHQALDIEKIAHSQNYKQVEIIQDLAGRDRIIRINN